MLGASRRVRDFVRPINSVTSVCGISSYRAKSALHRGKEHRRVDHRHMMQSSVGHRNWRAIPRELFPASQVHSPERSARRPAVAYSTRPGGLNCQADLTSLGLSAKGHHVRGLTSILRCRLLPTSILCHLQTHHAGSLIAYSSCVALGNEASCDHTNKETSSCSVKSIDKA